MTLIKRFLDGAIPFLLLGTAIAIGIVLFIFITQLLLWGIVIGAVLYVGYRIKQFFSPKPAKTTKNQAGGRIIEHSDL